MSVHYSLVEFTVTWYKAGEKVYDDPVLFEGCEWHDWPSDDCGDWVKEKSNHLQILHGSNWRSKEEDVDIFAPNKDMIAILGVNVLEEGPLHFEYEMIGTEVFDEWEEDIIELAKQIQPPKKNEQKYKTFLTLWRCTIDCYQGYEDLYPECEVIPELVGLVGQQELGVIGDYVGEK